MAGDVSQLVSLSLVRSPPFAGFCITLSFTTNPRVFPALSPPPCPPPRCCCCFCVVLSRTKRPWHGPKTRWIPVVQPFEEVTTMGSRHETPSTSKPTLLALHARRSGKYKMCFVFQVFHSVVTTAAPGAFLSSLFFVCFLSSLSRSSLFSSLFSRALLSSLFSSLFSLLRIEWRCACACAPSS